MTTTKPIEFTNKYDALLYIYNNLFGNLVITANDCIIEITADNEKKVTRYNEFDNEIYTTNLKLKDYRNISKLEILSIDERLEDEVYVIEFNVPSPFLHIHYSGARK